ncbi:MAG: hypothetical protein K9M45_02790 [Kiritimatiellales bacterium]|nr:hypothetical protein [Kiritimatiellales bacterium]
MFDRGTTFIVKVEERKLFFNGRDFLPLERVLLRRPNNQTLPVECFAPQEFPWIKVWVDHFSDGVLDCDVVDFKPNPVGFEDQRIELSNVRKLLLFEDNDRILELVKFKKIEPLASVRKPIVRQVAPPRPLPSAPPKPPPEPVVFEEHIRFRVPLAELRFTEGCANVAWQVYLPMSGIQAKLGFSVENRFLSAKLNCLKPYLAKCLGGGKINIRAAVRVRDGTVEEVLAESPALAGISPKLIGEVRYHFVKAELSKRDDRGGRIITLNRFFVKVKDAGFGDSDGDFLRDILRIKQPKHSAHIEYLAGQHRADLIRLRIVRKPFAFLCFLSGTSGGYFVWETLDGTDATYVWRLSKPVDHLAAHRNEFRRSLGWIEEQLGFIHAAGRNAYLREPPDAFRRIIHDYQGEDGFGKWKGGIEQLLEHGLD